MESTCTVCSVRSRVTDTMQPANGRLSAACSPLSPSLSLLGFVINPHHPVCVCPPFHLFSCFLWHATQHRHLTVEGENAFTRCYLFNRCLTKIQTYKATGRCSWLCFCFWNCRGRSGPFVMGWGSDFNKDAMFMSDSFWVTGSDNIESFTKNQCALKIHCSSFFMYVHL